MCNIGVTYHFLDWGYRTPTFQDTGEELAVIRGDLWRSNYTKTIFGRTPSPESSCFVSVLKHRQSLREGL